MNVANLAQAKSRFQVLQTTRLSQTAVMTLQPGGQSSIENNVHEKSDQILLVVEGEVEAEVAGERKILRKGDVCVVPAGTRHRFENKSSETVLTFSVYAPPEYAPGEKD